MEVARSIQSFSEKIKNYSVEQVVTHLLNLLPQASNSTLIKATYLLDRIACTDQKKQTLRVIREAFKENHPITILARRLLKELHPNCKKGLVVTFIVQSLLADAGKRADYYKRYGTLPPVNILISPTMRCNLRCVGCYANSYSRDSDLEVEIVDKVISQAKDIGIHFITLVGGEPFVYRPLLDIFRKHNDVVFQVFTNGTLIGSQVAKTLVGLGNVAPAISIEGFKEQTDARRGDGTFDALMRAMDYLREEGALFFFSVCSTRKNHEEIVSDEFVELMIEKGAVLGWYFNYMPVGKNPDLNLMPTPEQRNYIRARINQIRKEKPILLVDFWGDGPLVEGCLAGGKLYLHINNNGEAEPCIFAHFAVDSIRNKDLVDVLNSDFFRGIRRMQPFGHNDIRPCPLIDHPGAMRYLVKKYGARSTHEGAESLITESIPFLKEYAKRVAKIYEKVWNDEYRWVEQWRREARKLPKSSSSALDSSVDRIGNQG